MNNDEIIRISYSLATDLVARQSVAGQCTPDVLSARVSIIATNLQRSLRHDSDEASRLYPVNTKVAK